MISTVATQKAQLSDQLSAMYLTRGMAFADRPHLMLASLGFAEQDIMRMGVQLLALGDQAAADAQQLIRRAATAIAGLPLHDAGQVISQLRGIGLNMREIEIHLADIMGETMRQQRLAYDGMLS